MTLFHRNSKADTALLLDANLADIFVDHGQERTNLNDNTTYLDEASSARTAIDAPRSITVIVHLEKENDGTLVRHGNAVTYGYKLSISTDGASVDAAEAGLLRVSVPLEPIGKGDSAMHLIHWAQRDGGSGVGIVDELSVYRFDTGIWTFATAKHATPSAVSVTDMLTIGAGFGGADAGDMTINSFMAVHIGRRFHSTTEAKEDWVDESTAPVMTGRYRRPLLTGLSTDLEVASPGMFAGPSFNLSLAATRQADQRCVSPLVNIVTPGAVLENNTYSPPWFVRLAPDDPEYRWNIRYLWQGVAVKTNKARVRIFVTAYNVGDDEDPIAPLHFRMYSIEDMYTLMTDGVVTNWRRTPTATLSTPSPAGTWLDLGSMRVLRDNGDGVNFALGYSVNLDAGGAYDDYTAFSIKAVTIEPYFLPEGDGDDGFGGGGGGGGKGKKKKK